MRVTTSNVPLCPFFGEEESLRLIKKAGFDGIDYDIRETQLGDDFREVAKEVRAMLDELGLTCTQVRAPQTFAQGMSLDLSEPGYRQVFRSVEFARILGAQCCVIPDSPVSDGPLSGQYTEHNYLYYNSLEDEAKRCGIYIGVGGQKSYILNRLIGMLDSEIFYPHVDIGHLARMDIEPDAYLKRLNCLPVRTVRVHDFDTLTDGMLPFLGKSSWSRIGKALADIGYDGDFAMDISEMTRQMGAYSVELLPQLYELAAVVGRELIRRMNEERKVRT